jgi:hypothetical protein
VTEHSPPTVTGTTDDEACPYCGETHGVQPMSAPPKIAAWSCSACGLDWMITMVNPHLRSAYTVDLTAAAAEIHRLRRTLRQVVALTGDAPALTDRELRTRLLTLTLKATR